MELRQYDNIPLVPLEVMLRVEMILLGKVEAVVFSAG